MDIVQDPLIRQKAATFKAHELSFFLRAGEKPTHFVEFIDKEGERQRFEYTGAPYQHGSTEAFIAATGDDRHAQTHKGRIVAWDRLAPVVAPSSTASTAAPVSASVGVRIKLAGFRGSELQFISRHGAEASNFVVAMVRGEDGATREERFEYSEPPYDGYGRPPVPAGRNDVVRKFAKSIILDIGRVTRDQVAGVDVGLSAAGLAAG